MPEKEREIKGGDAMWSWRVSSCQTAAYQYSAPRQEREREMDGAQEGGRLKRQMKGRHIEGKRDVTTGSISDRERDQRVNE